MAPGGYWTDTLTPKMVMAYIVMAFIVIAYIGQGQVRHDQSVIAYTVMAYIVMAYMDGYVITPQLWHTMHQTSVMTDRSGRF